MTKPEVWHLGFFFACRDTAGVATKKSRNFGIRYHNAVNQVKKRCPPTTVERKIDRFGRTQQARLAADIHNDIRSTLMSTDSSTIVYTLTDEAPLLATSSLLPIIRTFTAPAGVNVVTSDISVAGRILGQFSD